VTHRAAQRQGRAASDRFRAGATQHLRKELDSRRRIIGADNLSGGRCVANESGGSANRVPDPVEPLALLQR
jgi:hypothetical protein